MTKGDPNDPDVYTYGYTDGSGQATFGFTATSNGPMNVSVTKHNYLPYQGTTDVQICTPGDANMDSTVDVLDLVKVKRIILGLDAPTCGADANEDGTVDVLDLVKIKRIILGLD